MIRQRADKEQVTVEKAKSHLLYFYLCMKNPDTVILEREKE